MVKALIVDDALFMRKMLADILKKEGVMIVGEAENAKMAIQKYKELKPDLVTMDIVMPKVDGLDGIAAVEEIIKVDQNAKIIMVTAMGQHSLMLDAMQAGAKDFIIKPFRPQRVSEALRRVLGDIPKA